MQVDTSNVHAVCAIQSPRQADTSRILAVCVRASSHGQPKSMVGSPSFQADTSHIHAVCDIHFITTLTKIHGGFTIVVGSPPIVLCHLSSVRLRRCFKELHFERNYFACCAVNKPRGHSQISWFWYRYDWVLGKVRYCIYYIYFVLCFY